MISPDSITKTFEIQYAGSVNKELRSILFDRTSILFVEQAKYRPSTPYLGALSTSACTMQDVGSNQALADRCDPYP